jgi:hypothetical protein
VIGKAKAGQKVQGLTGEVHTKPLKVTIKMGPLSEAVPGINNGDVVYLLTYQGEGNWKVLKKCKVIPNIPTCWDEKLKPESIWWVKIKLKDGTTGWTKLVDNFSDMDACG